MAHLSVMHKLFRVQNNSARTQVHNLNENQTSTLVDEQLQTP